MELNTDKVIIHYGECECSEGLGEGGEQSLSDLINNGCLICDECETDLPVLKVFYREVV
jgi:hypothetical protein